MKTIPTYEGYTGKKTWKVNHPKKKKAVTVKAPDSQTALVAAAEAFDMKWTAYDYYAFAVVTPI